MFKQLTQLNVSYLNAGEGIEIHMLIGLNHYWDVIQPELSDCHVSLSPRIIN